MQTTIKIGSLVGIKNDSGPDGAGLDYAKMSFGTVVGFTNVGHHLLFIIELNPRFRTTFKLNGSNQETHITLLVAHPDSLVDISDEGRN